MSKAPLPTSASDINPSDIRKDPLSLDELRKIKSLIDVAKSSGTGKQATSCQPLTGRRVMVPITSKAFFEGVLQPPVTNAGGPSAAEEQIVVNVGDGQLQEMSRVEACKYIDKHLDVLDISNKSQTKKTKTKSSGLKKGFLNNTKNKPSPIGKKSTIPQNKTEINQEVLSQQEAMFPLMEIREECDVRGNIVNSEVINMSNTMKRIDDGLKNEGDIAEAGGDGDGEKLGKLLADTLKESEADISTGIDNVNLHEEEVVNDVESTQQALVSDEDYEAILQRLEELERMEEEDEKSKMVNKTSSKRLQSGGWSKGFLNNTKKTSTKKMQKEKKQVKVEEDVKTIPSTRSTQDTQPRNDSRVSFSAKNEVKEIPRIGLNKVPQKTIPTNTTAGAIVPNAAMESSSGLDPFTPRETVPFEDNVFRGVVKERNSSTVKAKDQTAQDTTGERKKLSRFAQRRMQRE